MKFRILILTNLFIVSLIYGDLFFPENNSIKEKFRWTYSSVKNVPGYKSRGGTEITNFIECQSGNIYKIGSTPKELDQLEEGQNIKIIKTAIFAKVKFIEINKKQIYVSFIMQKFILIGICFSILIFGLCFFLSNIFIDLSLAFGSVFTYFTTIIYLFYQ